MIPPAGPRSCAVAVRNRHVWITAHALIMEDKTMSDFTFSFTDRATWISWRSDWRQRYAQASETIRATKREISEIYAGLRAGSIQGRQADPRLWSLKSALLHQRRDANGLMEERTAANEHKAEQLAARQIAA